MLYLKFTVVFLLASISMFGQNLFTNPNKVINNRKEGLWTISNFCMVIDFDGKYRLVSDYHGPKSVVEEGLYVNDEKEGFWKEYWIERDTAGYRKGNVKAIIEYHKSVPCGLTAEYYKSGAVHMIGRYENFQVNRYDTLQIPDLRVEADRTIYKDSIIHTTLGYRPAGDWHYFYENRTLHH